MAAGDPTSTQGVDEVVRKQLNEHLIGIEKRLDADGMSFFGPIVFGADIVVRDAVEGLKENRRKKLFVILDTQVGWWRWSNAWSIPFGTTTLRSVFIVPDRAMSAGTVFALSGDAIFMDYFSVLGPIDPQVEREKRADSRVVLSRPVRGG